MNNSQLALLSYPQEKAPAGDWDFTGEDTLYLTHALHPYLASMIPQIPRKLLQMYADSGTRVLDPFVGGGAVLVEAYLAGFAATGIDVNPLAVIISRAKTTSIPQSVLVGAYQAFDAAYASCDAKLPDFLPSARVDFWFKPYMFEPLAKLRAVIDRLAQQTAPEHRDDLWNLLACVFSRTVRDVSLTYRGEVRLRRLQGKHLEQFNPDVVTEFKKRMSDAITRVSQLPSKPHPHIYEGDTRTIAVGDDQFDLVITSPPYGDIKNTIPYHQFSKNMLYWLGRGDEALDRIRGRSLGAKNGQKLTEASETLQQTIARMSKPNLIHEAVCFYADYYDALAEVARVTARRIIIVIGHRILDGEQIDNAAITTDMMRSIGWDLETKYERSIRKKRINRKMGFGNNAQGGTIDSESILVYTPGG